MGPILSTANRPPRDVAIAHHPSRQRVADCNFGLSPDQTLVLINGKRRHVSALLNISGTVGRGSAAVDLNLVPGLAISRIEVLRDGASSQYGSDAIAGVIKSSSRMPATAAARA